MKRHALIGIVLFILALYLWSYKGTSHSPDEWFFIDAMNQALRSGFQALPIGHIQYLGLYALGVPLIVISQLVETFGTYQLLLFLNAFATAITVGVIMLLLLELGYRTEIAATVAIVYGAGTLAWPYSGYMLREPLAAMGLSLASFMLIAYHKRGGAEKLLGWLLIFTWVSLTKRTASFLILPFSLYLGWILYLRKEPVVFWKAWSTLELRLKVLLIIGGFLIISGIFFLLTKNYVPFPKDFREAFPDLHNLVALLVSPGWGLFTFCPVLLLIIPGLPGFLCKDSGKGLFLAGLGLVYLLASTRAYFWWGFWGWGPRQLNTVLPFLCLPLAEALKRFGNKAIFRVGFGLLFLLSTILAAMQALVSYPFYEEVFKAGISLPEYTWSLRTFPPLNHWRFLNIAKAEVVWASGTGIKWGVFLPLTFLLVLAFLLARNAVIDRITRANFALMSLIFALLFPISIAYTLNFSYGDEDFGGGSGFIEAFNLLRQEYNSGDKLIIYMWGEPPWAYIPRVAMLNYCKGLCPPHVVIIKEQFIDGHPEWKTTLRQLIGSAENVWVVMQGLAETSPERWVEFALAQQFYFAENKWTGLSVRVVKFKRGGERVIAMEEADEQFGLKGYCVKADDSVLNPSDFLYVDLKWELPLALSDGWKTSLQLLNKAGALVRQLDYPIAFLLEPKASRKDNLFTARYALRLSPDPGEYELILIVYNDQGRLTFGDGSEYKKLAHIKVP